MKLSRSEKFTDQDGKHAKQMSQGFKVGHRSGA
jgi:hypothetical protein